MKHENDSRFTLAHCNRILYPVFQGVESQKCASFQAAMDAGQPTKVDVDHPNTLTNGKINGLYVFFPSFFFMHE